MGPAYNSIASRSVWQIDKKLNSRQRDRAMDLRIHQINSETPVIATGSVDGVPFYFRVDGQQWSIAIDNNDPLAVTMRKRDGFYRCGEIDADLAAGCIPQDAVRRVIQQAAEEYEKEVGKRSALV
jgi:hypothetical protein